MLVLAIDQGSAENMVGAAAIALGETRMRSPDPRMLRAIAQALAT